MEDYKPGSAVGNKLPHTDNPNICPDVSEEPGVAPPGPYQKAANDYCEYHATPRRKRGTDMNGEVYVTPVTNAYRRGYENIKWNKEEKEDESIR